MEQQEIINKITAQLSECEIEVKGADCSFSVTIISSDFEGKNTLARHRLVNQAVADDIKSGALHALSITALTPEENA